MKTPITLLSDLNACAEARAFAATCPDLETAWLTCERGDWLLWFAAKRQGAPRTQLVFIACQCARLALPHAKDARVLVCIETAEAWTRGEATIEAVRNARKAAYAASGDTATVAAAYAADAADDDAYASAVAAAVAAYAADATRKKALRQCADIVRAALPTLPA